MTKEQIENDKTLGLIREEKLQSAIDNLKNQWNAANPTIPFALPTRTELTIIDVETFPMGKVHKGISLGLGRLTARKKVEAGNATHYPQQAIDFDGNVKFLLGAPSKESTPLFYETIKAQVKSESGEIVDFEINGKQVYNLVSCAENKYSSATTIEAPAKNAKKQKA